MTRSVQWRKSSRSGQEVESSCVEAAAYEQVIGLRDSRDPTGPILTLHRTQLATLLNEVKTGELP